MGHTILPLTVAEWLGMGSTVGMLAKPFRLPAEGDQSEGLLIQDLATLNDSGGADFMRIAQIIEDGWG